MVPPIALWPAGQAMEFATVPDCDSEDAWADSEATAAGSPSVSSGKAEVLSV